MVRIQLENGYLEVKEGTNFPLNFGVAEIRDVSARSGTFSKSITLIGSDNNNNLLNHYYDVNIQEGTFDINALTTCSVIQNGVPILEDCYLQLVSVNKVQNADGHDEGVEYTVVVKDAQADFFTQIDNKELTDIDLTDLNHTYSAANVITSFGHDYTDGYMYPLTFTPNNATLLTDFRPAVYAKTYFDRIHATNGFSYTWDSLSTAKFDKAVIPYNGDQPEIDYTDYVVEANKSGFYATLGSAVTSWTETLDDEGLFTPTTGRYVPPFYIGAGQSVNFQFTADIDIDLLNLTGADAYLVDMSNSSGAQGIKYSARVWLYINGSLAGGTGGGSFGSAEFAVADNPLAAGTTTLGTVNATIDVPATLINSPSFITVVLEIQKESTGSALLTSLKWKDAASTSANDVTITPRLYVNDISFRATLSVNTLGFGQTIEMNDFIPKKIKQKDFIKSICTMYNLVVEPDKDNPNKLIYKHRDDYYDDGDVKDWTYKLAKERSQDLQFLPDLSAKKLQLTYKQDKDSYNTNYELATNEIYGQVEFTFENEYVKGIDKKEIIFSPTPMGWNTFGAVVPLIIGAAPKTNIRILLHNGTKTCNGFTIQDYVGSTTSSTSYPMVSHFDDHFNPSFDINFAPCDYYYYQPILSLTNNSLFNLYWRRTIGQINSGKMLTAYFDLSEGDIQKLKLSDKIRIDNSYWNINRVVDYNANNNQLTKVELLSVDTEIQLPDFKVNVGNPHTPLPPDIKWTADDFKNRNVDYSDGSIILGTGNLIQPGTTAMVIGDDANIDSSGFWYNGEKLLPNPPRIDNVLTIDADYTVNPLEDNTIVVETSGVTITIPSPRDYTGYQINVKNMSGGNITVETTAGKFIDYVQTWVTSDGDNMRLEAWDDNTWIII